MYKFKQLASTRVSKTALAALLLALGVVACQTVKTTNAGTVGITRQQQMAVSAEEIEQASAAEYNSMVAGARSKGQLSTNAAVNNRVVNISKRLIAQVGTFRPDARGWNWQVNVFNSPEVNAFCMAGGRIGVYTGLIDKLKVTDDELAAVIGHEIAHALREHVREQVSDQYAANMGLQIVGALATRSATATQAVSQMGPLLAQTMFTLPRSRNAEVEADQMGVELAARAGYNPRAAVTLWQKMSQLGGAAPPEFMSTHPSAANRIQDLETVSAKVMPLYKK